MFFTSRFCILTIIVLCSLNSNVATESEGSFQRPPSDERIGDIQNNLLKVQSEILSINTALISNNNSSEYKGRLAALEQGFEKLKQQLRDERRENSSPNGKYDVAITRLIDLSNAFDKQLKILEQKSQYEASRRLLADIADEIRSRRFSEAQTLVFKIPQDDRDAKLANIVHDVYANSLENAEILLDFAKTLTRIESSYYVLTALRYEMRAMGHRDPFKMIALVKVLESEVVNQSKVPKEIKEKAQSVIDDTVADITFTAESTLKAAIYANNYQKNVQVETLANALADFRADVSDNIMQQIVKETYPTVSGSNLADDMNSNNNISQKAVGLVALYRKLESSNDLNNDAVLKVADYVNRLRKMENYKHIPEEKKQLINDMINSMKGCAKNLFFASKVCIYNKHLRDYVVNLHYENKPIWPGITQYNYQSRWIVENNGDKFYFRNVAYDNVYLYGSDSESYFKVQRYVFTRVDGGIPDNKGAWHIELNGDNCYLKNDYYNEYLYGSMNVILPDRRYVLSPIPSLEHPKFRWEIHEC